VIVFAPLPEPAPGLIDRYLVACADADIPALLVMNKADLLKENDPILTLLQEYQDLGYEVMQTQPDGDLNVLSNRLEDESGACVRPQGGVKSTLVNAIVPVAAQKTYNESETSALGQDTATSARLFGSSVGAALIRSPGIR